MITPNQKEISAFIKGMEYAASINARTERGCEEALKVRREAITLALLNERNANGSSI